MHPAALPTAGRCASGTQRYLRSLDRVYAIFTEKLLQRYPVSHRSALPTRVVGPRSLLEDEGASVRRDALKQMRCCTLRLPPPRDSLVELRSIDGNGTMAYARCGGDQWPEARARRPRAADVGAHFRDRRLDAAPVQQLQHARDEARRSPEEQSIDRRQRERRPTTATGFL